MAVLAMVAVAAPAAFGEGKNDEKEMKKLAGTWTMVSGEVDGKPVEDEHVKASRITLAPEKVTLVTPHQSKEPITAKLTRVDPSKKPAEMDWVRDRGPGAGKTMMAIYEWVDDDTYRICFDPSGKGRPKEFKTAGGTGYILHVWKRVK
jgi:uncharacterized protein (TIGR03067 family)